MKFINKYKSPNFNKRKKGSSIDYIIIHYTAIEDYKKSLLHLCNRKKAVSSHFLINKLGKIYKLVDINKRAWHAGKAYWKGLIDMNSESIGIELDNTGHHLKFEQYPQKQINSLSFLIRYIKKKYHINKKNILAHSDIAPFRKIDPGEKFPWKKLEKNNLSYYPLKLKKNEIKIIDNKLDLEISKLRSKKVIYMLAKIGYDTRSTKNNLNRYKMLIKAYQMHYMPKNVSGRVDEKTYKLILSHYIMSY